LNEYELVVALVCLVAAFGVATIVWPERVTKKERCPRCRQPVRHMQAVSGSLYYHCALCVATWRAP
jgi:formate dehydrogenase maturation protein FdhE